MASTLQFLRFLRKLSTKFLRKKEKLRDYQFLFSFFCLFLRRPSTKLKNLKIGGGPLWLPKNRSTSLGMKYTLLQTVNFVFVETRSEVESRDIIAYNCFILFSIFGIFFSLVFSYVYVGTTMYIMDSQKLKIN